MGDSIPVLWPDDIKLDVASPLAIMRAQAAPLRKATKGYLSVDVTSQRELPLGDIVHTMDLVAVPLSDYHYTIVFVKHRPEQVYPAVVDAPCLREGEVITRRGGGVSIPPVDIEVLDESDFIYILGQILTSPSIRSVIDSLLARINEEYLQKQPAPSAP